MLGRTQLSRFVAGLRSMDLDPTAAEEGSTFPECRYKDAKGRPTCVSLDQHVPNATRALQKVGRLLQKATRLFAQPPRPSQRSDRHARHAAQGFDLVGWLFQRVDRLCALPTDMQRKRPGMRPMRTDRPRMRTHIRGKSVDALQNRPEVLRMSIGELRMLTGKLPMRPRKQAIRGGIRRGQSEAPYLRVRLSAAGTQARHHTHGEAVAAPNLRRSSADPSRCPGGLCGHRHRGGAGRGHGDGVLVGEKPSCMPHATIAVAFGKKAENCCVAHAPPPRPPQGPQ
jgi:hypothetical protein